MLKTMLLSTITALTLLAAQPFMPSANYDLCFVPDGHNCENLLIQNINNTHKSLLVQAYSFTDPEIAKAILFAHKRGVDVRIIVDKSEVNSGKYSAATFFKNAGIPVWVDSKPAIAHNKVMIFDQNAVFTGSFNFTKAATNKNAENGIVIYNDQNIVKSYMDNWNARLSQSWAF